MELTADEQAWLDEYRQALQENYPGVVADLVVFDALNSKNPAGPVATVGVLVAIKGSSDREESEMELSWLGSHLARPYAIRPQIWVYTLDELSQRERNNALPFTGNGTSFWPDDYPGPLSGKDTGEPVELPDWARPETWKLRLRPYEKEWLADFRQALRNKYPELVQDLLVFANHDAMTHAGRHALNVVVKIEGKSADRCLVDSIEHLGYELNFGPGIFNPTFPFIRTYTVSEWRRLQQDVNFPYFGNGTSVWLDQPRAANGVGRRKPWALPSFAGITGYTQMRFPVLTMPLCTLQRQFWTRWSYCGYPRRREPPVRSEIGGGRVN